jgi:excisionase family DNA binding protein
LVLLVNQFSRIIMPKKTTTKRAEVDVDDLISQTQAAELRGVSRSAIHRLVKRKKLRGFEVGGRVLVSRLEVESYEPAAAGRPSKKGGN